MKQLKELDKLEAAGQAAKKFDFFVQWHLTERCNLRCRHCYQSGAGGRELSLPEIKDTIHEVADTMQDWAETYGMEFSPSFNITGGEPFLRKDIFDVLREIRRRRFDIFLLTNGTLASRERAKELALIGTSGVQVSIEGPEEVHDSIRGRGSFSQAMWGVKNLLNEGMIVTLNATLSNINARYMAEMVSLALGVGVQRLGFSRLVPSGRGEGLIKEMLTPEQVRELYATLLSLKIEGLEILTGDPVAGQMKLGTNVIGLDCMGFLGGCAAGISGITFLADGTITPCRRLPVPIGNIRTDSLREVWALSEVLDALRDQANYRGKCGTCKRWSICRGCRAIAYAWSRANGGNDFLAEDPQCFIEQYSPAHQDEAEVPAAIA